MNFKFPRYREFSFENVRELKIQPEDQRLEFLGCPIGGKFVEGPTEEGENPSEDNLMKIEGNKDQPKEYQISFENSFLREHEAAFQKYTKNFMEKYFEFYEYQISPFTYGQAMNGIQEEPFSSGSDSLALDYKNQLKELERLGKQGKLTEFFKFIAKQIPQEFLSSYFYLSQIFSQNCEEALKLECSEVGILGYFGKLARKIYDQEYRGRSLNFLRPCIPDSGQKELGLVMKEAVIEYIGFFLSTLMLIVEKYFSNPFCSNEPQNQMKRERSFEFDSSLQQFYKGDQGQDLGLPSKRCH